MTRADAIATLRYLGIPEADIHAALIWLGFEPLPHPESADVPCHPSRNRPSTKGTHSMNATTEALVRAVLTSPALSKAALDDADVVYLSYKLDHGTLNDEDLDMIDTCLTEAAGIVGGRLDPVVVLQTEIR